MLDYLGRLDHQVKIRGYRIELGEIESRLCDLPSIHQAAVVALPTPNGSLDLVAYVTARGPELPTFNELRTFLRTRLPEYFVPSRFVLLDSMPMTGSGKTDRKALATSSGKVLEPAAGEAPRNALEETLVRLWQSALGWNRVGIHDDFFQLGGHSLVAMRITAGLRRELGRPVPWPAFFRHRTVAQLAEALNDPDSPGGPTGIPRLAPDIVEGPVSPAQAQICFLHRFGSRPATYNVSFAYHLQGELDPERLKSAWKDVVHRHDILRTAIVDVAGELRQRIIPLPDPPFEIVDLTAFDPAARTQESEQLVQDVVCQAFVLHKPPLWRIQVQKLTPLESILVVSFQHAVVDEWSLRLLFQDLADTLSTGTPHAEPPSTPPLRYLEFAAWQQSELLGAANARDREFWRTQLAETPSESNLPADHPRSDPPSFRGGQVVFPISPRTRSAAEALSRQVGCSTFMLGLAAFDLLLARLSGQSDQVIGTPMSLRDRPELQGIAGLFLNLIPIRLRIDPKARLSDWLHAVRDTVLASFAHGALPSPEIVRASGLDLRPGQSPLFQILFIHLNEPWPVPRLPGVQVRSRLVHTATAKADLALFMTDDGLGGWRCEWEFAEDRFQQATVAGFAQSFCQLLDELVQHPNRQLSSWLTGGGSEGADAEAQLNPEPSPYPRNGTLGEQFAEAARDHSRRQALLGEGRAWTYAELDAASNQRARFLQSLGVSRQSPVGLHLDRSAEFVLNALAVVKAGGFYVPLAPDHPAARLRQLVSDLSLRWILSADPASSETFEDNACVIPIQRAISESGTLPDTPLDPVAQPLDPAYVMHTSGSTGVPKGVVVPHRAILRLVHGTDYLPWGPDLRFLHLAPTAFDASTLEIWGPLLHGGCCVVHPERLPTFEGLEKILREQRISCLWLTASLFNQIIDYRPQILQGVDHLLTGGEALSVPHVKRALAALPDTRLINGYGPTEATTFTTTYAIPRDGSIDRASSIPIGRPLANTRCHVLDANQRPVRPGSPGELYVGGDALALGYWNRPDLTSAAFILDPFRPGPDARLYRTGDRVRWRPDGNLEFIGRLDDQIKIRGFRIEPKEIEAVLRQCPGLGQSYVFARDIASRRELVACVEFPAHPQAAPNALQTVRAFAERQLPAHMIPSVWIVVDRFPLSPNGKTDHAALREKALGEHPNTAPRVDPRSEVEQRLAEIWKRVLGVQDVGVHDDFYSLGGYSLLAMRLVFEIAQEFGLTLSIADILKHRTIEALAALIGKPASAERRIQGTGTGPVLFFIPGVAGVNYIPDSIGTRLAKIGRYCDLLQYPGIDPSEEPKRTVADLAEVMIQRMRAIYPQGPVCLAGYSLGGSVAHEMARRMEAAGDPPVLVMLFDAATPDSLRPRKLGPALGSLKQRLICEGPWAVLRLVHRRFLGKLRSQRNNLAAELGLNTPAPTTSGESVSSADPKENLRKRVFDASFEAADSHRPGIYGGHVVLFRSSDPLGYGIFQECDALNGWRPHVTGRLDREDIPGDHWVLFREPGVTVLAERTAHWLGFAGRKGPAIPRRAAPPTSTTSTAKPPPYPSQT